MSEIPYVSATITVQLKPWPTPNLAIPTTDGKPSVAVGDLPTSAVDALARAWLDELYKKAGHRNPWKLTG